MRWEEGKRKKRKEPDWVRGREEEEERGGIGKSKGKSRGKRRNG